MKKLFIVLAVASLGFVACNNDGEKKDPTPDTPAVTAPPVDTPVVVPPVDSPATKDTTGGAAK